MQYYPANLSSACSAAPPALPAKGSWTEEEDKILLAYITKHGAGKWDEVARKSGLRRGGKSCRLRWKNQLHPRLKKEPFSVQEKEYIVHLHKQYGSKWSLIASHLPGRTDNAVKNICNSLTKRKQRAAGKNIIVQYPAATAPSSPPLLLPPPATNYYVIPCRELPSIQNMSPKPTTNDTIISPSSSPLMQEGDVDFWNSLMQDDQVPSLEDLLSEPLRQPVDSNTSAAGAEVHDVDFWNTLMQDINGHEPVGQFIDSDSSIADVNEMIPREVVAAPVLSEWLPYNMDYEVMQQNYSMNDWPGYGFDDGELQQNFFTASSMVDDDHCHVEMACDDDILIWGGFGF